VGENWLQKVKDRLSELGDGIADLGAGLGVYNPDHNAQLARIGREAERKSGTAAREAAYQAAARIKVRRFQEIVELFILPVMDFLILQPKTRARDRELWRLTDAIANIELVANLK
jgi:hypothetical protein